MSQSKAENNDLRRFVEPQSHEFTAHFNYNEFGLQPWFACDSIIKQNNGAVETQIDLLGDTWTVKLYSSEGSLIPPTNGETPAGTEVQHNHIREFRLRLEAHDSVGVKSANYHIRPRWQYQKGKNNHGDVSDINVPKSLANSDTDAVNVRVTGSNIDFGQYGTLLTHGADAVGINPRYFEEQYRHQETSSTQDAARHVRIHKDASGKIHSRTGPLVQLAHVLQNDRSGYRKLVQNDSDENGCNIPGYYHSVTLGPSRVREVLPNHRFPIECKHYYAREARSQPDSSPLAHPKLEVSYQQKRWNKSPDTDSETLSSIQEELDTMLYSVLHTAGLSLRAGDTYVEDGYFANENHTTTAGAVDLDLTEIKNKQESVVYKHLANGMAPTDRETLELLVTDGGNVSPQDIAETTGRHQDTVYDSLGRMHDLVEHTYGEVSLKSTYTSQMVADALQQAERAVETATNTAAKAVQASKRGLDDATSAFYAWCAKHGVDHNQAGGDSMSIELGEVDSIKEVREIIRMGLNHWKAMSRDAITFKQAVVEWTVVEDQSSLNYLTQASNRKPGRQRAFKLLK
jgi:hypothetical protein